MDPATSIVYQADNYYSTGTRKRVRKAPASDTSPTPRVVERTLREFRDSLSCYMFPVPPGQAPHPRPPLPRSQDVLPENSKGRSWAGF